jgi:hypothetical protein
MLNGIYAAWHLYCVAFMLRGIYEACLYAECRHAECRNAECRHAECRHAECHLCCVSLS